MIIVQQNSVINYQGIRYKATGEYRQPRSKEVYLKGNGGLNAAKHNMYESRLIYEPDVSTLTNEVIERFEKGTLKSFVRSGYITMDSDGSFFWHKNKPQYHKDGNFLLDRYNKDPCGAWDSSGDKCYLPQRNVWRHYEPAIYKDEDMPTLSMYELKYIDASEMCFKV